jgi:serine/threonine protein kinase
MLARAMHLAASRSKLPYLVLSADAFCQGDCATTILHTTVQEFCNGGSLRDALAAGYFKTQCMPQRWAPMVGVLSDIARGMEYMHAKRICHGDLNPSNVLFKVRL